MYPIAPLPDYNSRQSVQTIRPPSTSLLTIDSEDRFKNYLEANAAGTENPQALNATPYNFAIRKSESLMNGFFTRVGVSEINFPWAVPNINRKTNQMIFEWSGASSGSITIQLVEGFYTPDILAATIEGIIQAADASLASFAMTYGTGDQPRFLYNANNGAIAVAFFPMDYNSTGYPFPSTTKQLFNLMGFSDLNSDPSQEGVSGFTFCQFTKYVDITCYQLTNNQSLKDQTSQTIARDMLCRIYLGDANAPGNITPGTADPTTGLIIPNPAFVPAGCAPFIIYRNFATPKQIQWIPNQPIPGYLAFQVYDDSGALLSETLPTVPPVDAAADQATFLDWNMTMLVSEN